MLRPILSALGIYRHARVDARGVGRVKSLALRSLRPIDRRARASAK